MQWMYGGILFAFYPALGLAAIWQLPDHPNPKMGAMAFFFLVPLMLAGMSAEGLNYVSRRRADAIVNGFKRGRLTRRYAFGVGFIAGSISVIMIVGVWLGISISMNTITGLIIAVLVSGGILIVAPLVAVHRLLRRLTFDN